MCKNYMKKIAKLMKEIKDNLNKWRDIPCSGFRRFHIVKMFILSNVIYGFNTISIKIPASYLFICVLAIDKPILKFI